MCDGGKCLFKFILVTVNIIFLLLGIALLTVGIIAAVDPGLITKAVSYIPQYDKVPQALDLTGLLQSSGIFMIVLGVIVAAVGFFGCCGAFCENKCLLITYAIILVPVLAGEVALIIYSAVAPSTLADFIQTTMNKTISKVNQDVNYTNNKVHLPDDVTSLGWAVLQFEAKCCGAYNYSDYKNWFHNVTYGSATVPTNIPVSCCKTSGNVDLDSGSITFVSLDACLKEKNATAINSEGCYKAVDTLIRSSTTIAIGIAAGIIGVEVILLIVSICLCRSLDNKYRE